MDYETFRHFADSWGLVYMFGVFMMVILFLLRPGAGRSALDAAQIPLRDSATETGNE